MEIPNNLKEDNIYDEVEKILRIKKIKHRIQYENEFDECFIQFYFYGDKEYKELMKLLSEYNFILPEATMNRDRPNDVLYYFIDIKAYQRYVRRRVVGDLISSL